MSWQDVGLEEGLNQSRIKTYLRCPRQFYYAYVKGIKKAPNLKMVVGTAVHAGVEHNYGVKLVKKALAPLNDVLDHTRDAFRKNAKDADGEAGRPSKKELGASQDEAIALGTAHYQQSAPKFQPLVKPEQYFSIMIPGAKRAFFGTIDLIASYYSRLSGRKIKRAIADTKTTRRAYDKNRVHLDLQLTAYAYADSVHNKAMADGVIFDTVILKGGNTYAEQHVGVRTKAQFTRFEDTFKQVENGIDHGVFPPADDEKICGWCGYRDICHKGTKFST